MPYLGGDTDEAVEAVLNQRMKQARIFTYGIPGLLTGAALTTFFFTHNLVTAIWDNLPTILGLALFLIGLLWLCATTILPENPNIYDRYGETRAQRRKSQFGVASFMLIIGLTMFVFGWGCTHMTNISDATSCLNRGGVSDSQFTKASGQEYSVRWTVCHDGYSFTTPSQ